MCCCLRLTVRSSAIFCVTCALLSTCCCQLCSSVHCCVSMCLYSRAAVSLFCVLLSVYVRVLLSAVNCTLKCYFLCNLCTVVNLLLSALSRTPDLSSGVRHSTTEPPRCVTCALLSTCVSMCLYSRAAVSLFCVLLSVGLQAAVCKFSCAV